MDNLNQQIQDVHPQNFENFRPQEYMDNLKRLGITKHSDLIGKTVYYSQKAYGKHKVINWYEESAEYLLELDNCRFRSNPFRIMNIKSK